MSELVFEVTQEEDGGFCAECLSENIFTQGDTWEAVRKNVQEAVRAYYFDQPQAPKRIRLHLVRDELLAHQAAGKALLEEARAGAKASPLLAAEFRALL